MQKARGTSLNEQLEILVFSVCGKRSKLNVLKRRMFHGVVPNSINESMLMEIIVADAILILLENSLLMFRSAQTHTAKMARDMRAMNSVRVVGEQTRAIEQAMVQTKSWQQHGTASRSLSLHTTIRCMGRENGQERPVTLIKCTKTRVIRCVVKMRSEPYTLHTLPMLFRPINTINWRWQGTRVRLFKYVVLQYL